MDLEDYREWYRKYSNGKNPSDKLIESFCKINGVQQVPKEESETPILLGSGVKMKFGGENDGV